MVLKEGIFPCGKGKKRGMEKRNEARAQGILQHLSGENCFRFTFNNRRVRIVFSEKADAPTVEDGLAKILIGRIG